MRHETDRDDPDAVWLWHRRGLIRFGGCFVVLALATAVTDPSSPAAWLMLAGVVVGTGVLFGLLVATQQIHRRWSLMMWPLALCAGISALDLVAHQAAGLVMGLVVLSFLFIGLSQPPRRGLWFVPPAALLFLQVQDLEPKVAAVRLPISALVWIICAEIPAKLIKELREKQRALELLATTDSLTGLLNRSGLDVQLERAGASGAVAIIDLDLFKQFNDRFGHVAGDVALMDFAAELRGGTRPTDKVFRYGGEEFVIVLVDTTVEEATGVLSRIGASWADHPSGLTFSAGVTRGGIGAVRAADALLYRAKAEGRDRVIVDPATSNDRSARVLDPSE